MTTPTPQPVSQPTWVPTRKVLTQLATNVLTFLVALAVSHFGLKESAEAAGIVSAVIGIAAGAVAGYLVREIPRLEQDAAPKAVKM